MKRLLPSLLPLLLLVFTLGHTAAAQTTTPAAQKKRIAVLTFENTTLQLDNKSAEDIGRQIADLTATRFIQEHKFAVIERARIDQIMKEQITDTDRFDPQTAAKIGKIANVNALVMGTISEFNTKKSCKGAMGFYRCKVEAKVGLTMRLVDVNTGEFISAVDTSAREKEETTKVADFGGSSTEVDNDLKIRLYSAASRKAVDDGVKRLIIIIDQKIQGEDMASGSMPAIVPSIPANSFKPAASPANGAGPVSSKTALLAPSPTPAAAKSVQPPPPANQSKVVVVEGNVIRINAGKAQNVSVGSTFVVYRQKMTTDPDTGEVLDVETQVLGKIKIIEVRDRISIGTLISGSGIKPGALVKPDVKDKP
jgi:curli biogenesis system outer membrane secretion channel CsgG